MNDINKIIITTLNECCEDLDFVAKGETLNKQLISAVSNTLYALADFIDCRARLKRDL